VPTTGAGPSCSILGNALERGYGITPISDHFLSLISLEVVLADGSIYESPFKAFQAYEVSALSKWGIGPYIDGIFTQSNFGIVTKITLCLAKKKECIELFMFPIYETENFKKTIPVIRALKQSLGGIIGGINLMNDERMEAMFGKDNVKSSPTWTGLGALYGPPGLVKEAKKIVSEKLKRVGITPRFINQKRIDLIKKIEQRCPQFVRNYFSNNIKLLNAAQKFYQVLNGKPSKVALPLAYLKNVVKPDFNCDVNPALDGCGLIWFSPLLPIKAETVSLYIKQVYEICKRNDIAPLITLTTVSENCFNSTIPILFQKEEPDEKVRAKKCYKEFLSMGENMGIIPYRINIDSMGLFEENQHLTSVQLIGKIKQILDPNNILSPGRYNIVNHID
ncbi:MAG: hypothetical protein QGH06_08790, partial [Lutibacter sp.]|nr:hypothetical protein [Lutibacter sp.]